MKQLGLEVRDFGNVSKAHNLCVSLNSGLESYEEEEKEKVLGCAPGRPSLSAPCPSPRISPGGFEERAATKVYETLTA